MRKGDCDKRIAKLWVAAKDHWCKIGDDYLDQSCLFTLPRVSLTMIDSEIDVDVARKWESIEAVCAGPNRAHSTTENQFSVWRSDFMLPSSTMVR